VEPQFFWHIIPSTERFIVVVVVILWCWCFGWRMLFWISLSCVLDIVVTACSLLLVLLYYVLLVMSSNCKIC